MASCTLFIGRIKPRELQGLLRECMIRGTVLTTCPGKYNYRCQHTAIRVAWHHQVRSIFRRWYVAVEEDYTFTVLQERAPTKGVQHDSEAHK